MQDIKTYDFSGKKAIVRVDFNVPLNDKFEVADDTRIRAALATINQIIKKNGSVILMSHLGRPKSGYEERFSLKHIVNHLSELLGKEVKFADNCIGQQAKDISSTLISGEILLLENLRFYKEEKSGDEDFAKKLSELADIYVNDAFGTAHRAHASTTVIAKFFPNDKMFGYLIENELTNIDNVVKNSKKPFTAIMGGAKVSSKISIIKELLKKVDNLIIGGGMTYTFIKAQGGNIGSSLVEENKLDMALEIIDLAKKYNVNLLLPIDSINADKFANDANIEETEVGNVSDNWIGLDIGNKTIEKYIEVINNSATILWNGPMGVFEMSNFEKGTKKIGEAIALSTQKGAFSLVGGGDSVAATNKYGLSKNVSYISTGGGALLEYMEGKELPGIKAIKN